MGEWQSMRGGAAERTRPTDADHGAMVWPVVKLFLESDFTLTSLAKAIGANRARVERAILDPGGSKLDIWAAMASALGAQVTVALGAPPRHAEKERGPGSGVPSINRRSAIGCDHDEETLPVRKSRQSLLARAAE
jgi:hypothetical protein